MYVELPPPLELAPLVDCFWEQGERPGPYAVLPDGCFDVILHHDGLCGRAPTAVTETYLVGPQMRPIHAEGLGRGLFAFGVRFRPGAGFAALGVPLVTLQDRREDLRSLTEAVPRGLARALEDAVGAAASFEGRARRCAGVLLSYFRRAGALARLDVGVASALARLEESAGALPLDRLAAAARCSPRQLERRFARHAGYTPKQYARLARFRAALRSLERSTTGADLAAALGYADQAHLIHEFRAFSGSTPAAFRKGRG